MSDLFAGQSEIAARLTTQVTSATTYYGSQVIGANSQGVTLPALIVAPGEASLKGDLPPRLTGATEWHQWRVGVRCTVNPGAAQASRAEHAIGTLCYSVISALHGYQFTSGTPSRLQYLGREEMMYAPDPGYAEVWLKFGAEMAIN